MNHSTHVLFVEDEPYFQKIYGEYLEKSGLTLTYARNGEEAMKHLKEHKVDMIVSDLIMPFMSGLKFIKEARKKHKGHIIVLTALTGETDRQDALNAGAHLFFSKESMNPEQLLKAIRECCKT